MIEYFGNCKDLFNWEQVIKDIEHQTPAYVGPSHKESDNIPGLDEVTRLWKQAEYVNWDQGGTVGWDMFIPGKNFDMDIPKKFCEFVGLESYTSCWISRINQGMFAPQHWDVNDCEEELAKQPDKIRFHCHIMPPTWGHILIVDDQCLYNQPLGSVYKWSSRKLWHAGTNCGLVPKYLFNIW